VVVLVEALVTEEMVAQEAVQELVGRLETLAVPAHRQVREILVGILLVAQLLAKDEAAVAAVEAQLESLAV
jgi:hypothetical protein